MSYSRDLVNTRSRDLINNITNTYTQMICGKNPEKIRIKKKLIEMEKKIGSLVESGQNVKDEDLINSVYKSLISMLFFGAIINQFSR